MVWSVFSNEMETCVIMMVADIVFSSCWRSLKYFQKKKLSLLVFNIELTVFRKLVVNFNLKSRNQKPVVKIKVKLSLIAQVILHNRSTKFFFS